MSNLELALIVLVLCLLSIVGLLVDMVLVWRARAMAAADARAETAGRLAGAKQTIAALSFELNQTQRRHAKAEQDLRVACALRPLSIHVPHS